MSKVPTSYWCQVQLLWYRVLILQRAPIWASESLHAFESREGRTSLPYQVRTQTTFTCSKYSQIFFLDLSKPQLFKPQMLHHLPWVMLSSSLLTLSQRINNIPFILFYIIIQLIIFHFLRLQFGFRYQGFLFKHFFIKTDAHLFSALTPFSRVMFFNSLKHKVSIS